MNLRLRYKDILFTALLYVIVPAPLSAAKCGTSPLQLQVLGSGGPEFGDNRASTSYLIWYRGKARALVDFGGGAALRFEQSGANISDLFLVMFTHLHVDHSADFPALVKASYFSDRKKVLPVYGPAGNSYLPATDEFLNRLISGKGVWPYLSDYLPGTQDSDVSFRFRPIAVKTDGKKIVEAFSTPEIKASAVPVHHGPLPALAWRIDTNDGSITISGDMNGDFKTLEKLAKNTDLLVAHHAVPEGASGVARSLHMPPSVIADIADNTQAKQLVLSHLMKRTIGREKETQKIVAGRYQGEVHFANDLDCFTVK